MELITTWILVAVLVMFIIRALFTIANSVTYVGTLIKDIVAQIVALKNELRIISNAINSINRQDNGRLY